MKELKTTFDLRKKNRNRIYRTIQAENGSATKQSISKKLGLSMPTVLLNLQHLLEEDLIEYNGKSESTGGRKALNIRIKRLAKVAIGVSITAKSVLIAVVNLDAKCHSKLKIKLAFKNNNEYLERVADEIKKFIKDNDINNKDILGVGFALPGIIEKNKRKVIFAPTMCDETINLEYLDTLLSYKLLVMNDANASGYAESCINDDVNNMAYLLIGRGVGGSIITNGKNYFGSNGYSGEFGHMCIIPDGKLCSCGRKGCLESYCSTKVLSDEIGLTLEEFFINLNKGDERIKIIWDKYLTNLARGIFNINIMLDCEIVIAGLLSSYMEPYLEVLERKIDELRVLKPEGKMLRLGRYDGISTCVGVALQFIDKFIAKV